MTRTLADAEGIADVIVRIPRTIQATDGVSVYDLVARSGYFEQHEGVSESVIRKRLSALPELIGEWLSYSEDKRVGSGWYFRAVTSDLYEVGYYDGATGEQSRKTYAAKFEACAKFIKEEVEDIRSR